MNEKWARLIIEPDNSVDSGGPWCDVPEEVAEASKKPFEIKALQLGHSERSLTPRKQPVRNNRLRADHVGLTKRHKPWPHPNITAEPRYAEEKSNIFLKLQKRPMRNEFFNPSDEFMIPKVLPPPDDMDVQISDSNHLSFF